MVFYPSFPLTLLMGEKIPGSPHITFNVHVLELGNLEMRLYVYSSDMCECESPVLTPKPFHYYSCISDKNMATISCTCHQGMALGLKFSWGWLIRNSPRHKIICTQSTGKFYDFYVQVVSVLVLSMNSSRRMSAAVLGARLPAITLVSMATICAAIPGWDWNLEWEGEVVVKFLDHCWVLRGRRTIF